LSYHLKGSTHRLLEVVKSQLDFSFSFKTFLKSIKNLSLNKMKKILEFFVCIVFLWVIVCGQRASKPKSGPPQPQMPASTPMSTQPMPQKPVEYSSEL
jgi:hypothetical protein